MGPMANTHLIKKLVEPYVRERLEENFGQPFAAEFLTLPGGGRHEFDAVAHDRSVVAAIKSHSGLTSGGNLPSAKILACYAELYYLLQVEAPDRLLVVTNPDFFGIFERHSRGRLHPELRLVLVALPEDLQEAVTAVSQAASDEMAGSREAAKLVADLVVTNELPPTHE